MTLAVPTAGNWGDVVALALLAAIAAPVSVIDVRMRRIPDAIVVPALVTVALVRGVVGTGGWASVLIWACAAGAVLFVPAVIRPDGMGMGDVKLAALIGACLGAAALAAVLIALIAGALGGAAHALRRGLRVRDATIPFGPFLVDAALAVALPVAFVHSAHATGHAHDATGAGAAVRPAGVRIGGIRRHAPLGRAGAARGARHIRGAGPRCGGAAPRRRPRCGGTRR